MSMIDVVSTISRIQTTLAQLNTEKRAAVAAPAIKSTSAATNNADAFSLALTAAGAPPLVSSTTVSGTTSGAGIIECAKKYIGVPYVWGGTDPATGLDCSGLVQRVYKDLGIDLPRVAIDQGNAGTSVPNLSSAKPGDLLIMNRGQHIGIYMGGNQYIHAPAPGQSVQIADIPPGAAFDRITRILPNTDDIPTSANSPAMTNLLSLLQTSLATGVSS